MLRIMKYIAVLFIGLSFSIAHAESASDTLLQLLKNTNSIRANFTETIVDQKGKALNQSSGTMSLQRPGQFRWDVKKPNPQLVVTNGKRLWIYDPDLEQVTIRMLTKEAGEAPALLLSNSDVSLQKNFRVQRVMDGSEIQWFVLTPKDSSSMFESIKLGFAANQIQQMQLTDHLGHVTQIVFNNVQVNDEISSSQFSFTPPANVDIIDETKR